MDTTKLYINGEWVTPKSNDTISVENPADQSELAKVPRGGKEDTEDAIKAAKSAFIGWSSKTKDERISYVEKIIQSLKDDSEEMSKYLAKELGMPVDFALNRHIKDYYVAMDGFVSHYKDMALEEKEEGFTIYKEPIGVVGAITPWNYPFGQIVKKVIPAILTGNTVILKPSKSTPLTAYYWAKAADEAKLPAGVFNLVTGNGSEVGDVIANSKDVDMVSFTGSTSGGKEVGSIGIKANSKTVALELGGKSAAIILEDADLKPALKEVLSTVYLNCGQTCSAKTRLFLPNSLEEEGKKIIKEITDTYTFGDPNKKGVNVGPLNSKKQFDKVKSYLEKGVEEGAELFIGEIPKEGNGYYVKPAVFWNANNNMTIAREEIFGPVLTVILYDDVEDAIEMANDSIYGLSGAVYGSNALDVAKKLRTGQIHINCSPGSQNSPFGGYKESGIGREGGKYGLLEYLQIKTIFHQ